MTGDVGAPPVVRFDAPLELSATETEVLVEGAGRELGAGDPAVLAVTTYDGNTGEILDQDTSGRARVLAVTEEDLGADLHRAVLGLREGSRLLMTQPVSDAPSPDAAGADADGGTPTAQPPTEAAADRMLLVVVDVLPSVATGQERELPADLGVALTSDDEHVPSLTVTDAAPPERVRIAYAREGNGAPVLPGQVVTIRYHAIDWATGEVYDSSWATGRGPQVVAVDDTFPALQEALLDAPIGSRIVLASPAAQAFGDAALAMVVDVVAASGEPTS